jgi:hypothetical protein
VYVVYRNRLFDFVQPSAVFTHVIVLNHLMGRIIRPAMVPPAMVHTRVFVSVTVGSGEFRECRHPVDAGRNRVFGGRMGAEI